MSAAGASPLQLLSALGQSVWIDFLSRESIRGGHLQRLIDDDAVVGATSNPTIFQKAMTQGEAYDEQLRELATRGCGVAECFWALAETDIAEACERSQTPWKRSQGSKSRTARCGSARCASSVNGSRIISATWAISATTAASPSGLRSSRGCARTCSA